jgi:hypothetical protein
VHLLGQGDNRFQMPCFEPLLHGPSPISLKIGINNPAVVMATFSTADTLFSTGAEPVVNLGSPCRLDLADAESTLSSACQKSTYAATA